MNLFTAKEYGALATLFHPDYPGYRPTVLERPNGDQHTDVGKRYLHVALKYTPPCHWACAYLARAHFEACRVAEAMGVPDAFYPRVADGTLRVLDYPAGAGTAEHTDFNLFTIHCYRSHPFDFERLDPVDTALEAIDPDVHLGELAEHLGLGKATRHRVPARPYTQQAIVYFAMPSHTVHLPGGLTVGEWLKERMSRSRVYT